MEESEYVDNQLTEEEKRQVALYVTDVNADVFGFTENLPQNIAALLVTRNSRSQLLARKLLATEFLTDTEEKTEAFFKRVLGAYGDDSVQEQQCITVQFENVSMLLAKELERSRFTSPIEKSTRYIPFHLKDRTTGQYAFYRGEEIRAYNAAFYDAMVARNNELFDAYARWMPIVMGEIAARMTEGERMIMSESVQRVVVRTKTLDAIRLVLPAGALTNVGITANARTMESLCLKLQAHFMGEMANCGHAMQPVFQKLCPEFTRRYDPDVSTFAKDAIEYYHSLAPSECYTNPKDVRGEMDTREFSVSMECFPMEENAVCRLIFFQHHMHYGMSREHCASLGDMDIRVALRSLVEKRKNRRFHVPRSFECFAFTFAFETDYKIWCDLQRHRILSTDHQPLGCNIGYVVPDVISQSAIHGEYLALMNSIREEYNYWLFSDQSVDARYLQYMVPMGFKMRWFWVVNLRELFHILELRSAPEGHPTYRRICKTIYGLLQEKFPFLTSLMTFVQLQDVNFARAVSATRSEMKK